MPKLVAIYDVLASIGSAFHKVPLTPSPPQLCETYSRANEFSKSATFLLDFFVKDSNSLMRRFIND